MLKVDTVIEQMKVGDSHPFLVVCSDQKQYVMKYSITLANDSKALMNELVGYRIMDYFELDHPAYKIATLSQEIINSSPQLFEYSPKEGTIFLTNYEKITVASNPIMLERAKNIDTFLNIIFFDQFVVNVDRGGNPGNLVMDAKTKRVNVIDNDRILKQQQFWTPQTLSEISKIPPFAIEAMNDVEYKYLIKSYAKAYGKTKGKHSFNKILGKLKNLTNLKIESWVSDIPDDWNISEDDIIALKKFFCYQRDHADDIAKYLAIRFNL
ncbi:HipA family kinase [Leuconostoc lactis]|uniref:HipA family kinase n=1 Tax=Leuconostoc lactis TaxID=1246 RepID=UPI0024201AEF|nr:HipA family kinase [Leuconostoc lactis]